MYLQGTDWYPTFHDMLETEGLAKALPGVESMTEGRIDSFMSFCPPYSEALW